MKIVEINASLVNDLRKKTGAGLMECKKALVESNGDMEEAITILKKKGIASAAKKAGREATEGVIQSYIHGGGRVGVLLQLNCETDFVAKNNDFTQLAKDIAMQIAAASPLYVGRDDVPEQLMHKEKEIAKAQAEGKPAQAVEKIVEGKLSKWYKEICLLEQVFVKDPEGKKTIQDVINEMIARIGENIKVSRFVRYQLGE